MAQSSKSSLSTQMNYVVSNGHTFIRFPAIYINIVIINFCNMNTTYDRRAILSLAVLEGVARPPDEAFVSPFACGTPGLGEGLFVGVLFGMDLVVQEFFS